MQEEINMGRLLLTEVFKYRVVGDSTFWPSSSADAPMVALTYGGYTPLTRSSSSGPSNSSGSNGLNIVAAILVTASSMMVLLALRLWLCRCSSSSAASPVTDPGESVSIEVDEMKIKKDGIARDVINKFALVDYKELSSSKYDKICTVCLSDFSAKDLQIRLLPGCNHSFHPACIEMWLFSHASCPICRKSFLPVAASSLTTNSLLPQQAA